MDDYLCDFLKYELASKEELEEEIYNLDKAIEESKNNTECARVYSCLYGYYTDALELRIKPSMAVIFEKLERMRAVIRIPCTY